MKLKKIFFSLLLMMLNGCSKQALLKGTASDEQLIQKKQDDENDSSNKKILPVRQYLEYISHLPPDDIFKDSEARRLAIRLAILVKDPESIVQVTIESDRFKAVPLYSQEQTWDKYEGCIRELYEVTLGNAEVVQKYRLGRPYTKEEFVKLVNECSRRWAHGYPFAGFMILNKHTNEVVGYETIVEPEFMVNSQGVTNLKNTGSGAICLRKKYHKCDAIQDVGYECFGALCLVYGQYLFEREEKINRTFNDEKQAYIGGESFKSLQITTRVDNISRNMPAKVGFVAEAIVNKHGYIRILFKKVYKEQKEKPLVTIRPRSVTWPKIEKQYQEEEQEEQEEQEQEEKVLPFVRMRPRSATLPNQEQEEKELLLVRVEMRLRSATWPNQEQEEQESPLVQMRPRSATLPNQEQEEKVRMRPRSATLPNQEQEEKVRMRPRSATLPNQEQEEKVRMRPRSATLPNQEQEEQKALPLVPMRPRSVTLPQTLASKLLALSTPVRKL